MTPSIRELQVTPLPDVIEGPGLGFLTLVAGLRLPRLEGGAILRDIGQRALPWLVPVGLIVLWQVAASLGWLSTRVLPAPSEVIKAAWALAVSGELWTHVKVSAWRALAGLAIGGGLGLMWVILIVAETISAQAGIGYLTMNAREFLQTDVVLVGILLYALLGKLADVFARGLERYWLRWHPGYQSALSVV